MAAVSKVAPPGSEPTARWWRPRLSWRPAHPEVPTRPQECRTARDCHRKESTTGLRYTDRSSIFVPMTQETDTRQQILDAAAALFHTQSYSDVGVATICSRAGVSKGSFFHFFPSKRDLALAVMDQYREQIHETLIARAFSPKHPPLERLEQFVTELHAFQKAQTDELGHLPGCPFGNLAMEQATQDEVLRQKADGCLRWLASHVRTAVSEAVQNGALPPVDEEATADAMLGYLEGIQLLAKARNDPEVIRRLGPLVTSIHVRLKR